MLQCCCRRQAGGTTPVACKSSLGTRNKSGLAFPCPHSYFPGGCEGQRTELGGLHPPSPPRGSLARSIVSTWTTLPLLAGLHPHALPSLTCCALWFTPAPVHSQCPAPGGAARAAAPHAAAASSCRPVKAGARCKQATSPLLNQPSYQVAQMGRQAACRLPPGPADASQAGSAEAEAV